MIRGINNAAIIDLCDTQVLIKKKNSDYNIIFTSANISTLVCYASVRCKHNNDRRFCSTTNNDLINRKLRELAPFT